MAIMTIYDSLTDTLSNWDTETPLCDALRDIIPASEERAMGIVNDIDYAVQHGSSDEADTLATMLGLTMQPRRLALAWRRTQSTLVVTLEEWDPYAEEWTSPVDPALAEPVECLLPGDDWEDDAPYTAAEDRLLAGVGLTRDDISETLHCW